MKIDGDSEVLPVAEHSRYHLDGLQSGADGPSVPALEVFQNPNQLLISSNIPL